MRNDEFKSIPEFEVQKENKTFNENVVISENAAIAENVEASESTDATTVEQPKIDPKKKQQALSLLSGSLTTVIAGVVVGITTMLNVNMKASFSEVTYEDGIINYTVSVENMTEDETLTAYLYEGGELIETTPLIDEDGDGIITGQYFLNAEHIEELLAAADNVTVKYNIDLKGVVGLNVERQFDNYAVKIDKMTSTFDKIESECHCSVDGCFHFQMFFSDDFGLFDEFTATLEDDFGNVATCVFTEDLHEEQKINVMNLKGSNVKFTLSFLNDGVLEERVINTTI